LTIDRTGVAIGGGVTNWPAQQGAGFGTFLLAVTIDAESVSHDFAWLTAIDTHRPSPAH
jgi:hypothetical protein